MDLAVEYMIRTGACESLLVLPTSVFLFDDKNNRHVFTIGVVYGKTIIKHYDLTAVPHGARAPLHNDYIVEKRDLFDALMHHGKDFYVIPYTPQHFPLYNIIMTGDEPDASRQEKALKQYYDNYLYSQNHTIQKTQFLWSAFVNTQVSEEIKKSYAGAVPQTYVSQNDRAGWVIWNTWRKIMILDSANVPGELVFARCFKKLMKDIKPAQPWWYF